METVSSNQNLSHLSSKSDKSKSHKARHCSKTKTRKPKKVNSLSEGKNIGFDSNTAKWKLLLSPNHQSQNDHASSCCSGVIEEWKFSSLILAWGRERIFHILGLLSLLICAILFTLQAYMAFRSYQIMHQLNVKKHVPEMLYQFYFDSHDWHINLDKVDLKANTTIFIH
ncbi:hypothetical protein BgiBS90_029826 [Biomphalaria glabrata]|nr:hypothetical protein BgiBS90_029826 [Biomphalaria glabrata]